MTKAAAWIATVKWALKLKDEGFVVVSLSPGLVDTMGTKDLPSESTTLGQTVDNGHGAHADAQVGQLIRKPSRSHNRSWRIS